VHAHGDNQDLLREYVPKLRNVIGTTQTRPPHGLYNFGGFTDGDRCVFFARYLRASEIKLIGFDFDDMSVTPRKHKKLAWAKRLIELALSDEDS
jgi:2-amino-4-hydroxy-6-hydroxymethyldihydropteridine diphosphokinase